MKIDPNNEIMKQTYRVDRKPDKRGGGKDFGAFLKESFGRSSTQMGALTTQPPAVNHITGLQLNMSTPGEKIPIIEQVEKCLDILDEYQKKLADPQVTLKEIYPLIDKMAANGKSLTPVLDSLPGGDDLKGILNQTLLTSSLEVIKFNRGDYLSP